jgi:hypothetical protein
MPPVEFEPTISVLERAKTFRVLHRLDLDLGHCDRKGAIRYGCIVERRDEVHLRPWHNPYQLTMRLGMALIIMSD